MEPDIFVVMGVSGCGKSTVALQLAARLGLEFIEGDELHSAENVARMAAGVPLTDADREGWLKVLSDRIREARLAGRGLVLSCSALKRSYRDVLRQGSPAVRFVHLHGERALLAARMAQRAGHYMPASLLDSQLAALEAPEASENALTFNVTIPPDAIVAAVVATVSHRTE
jgi:gluconokinase